MAAVTFPRIIMIKPNNTEGGVAATGVYNGLPNAVYYDSVSGYFNVMGKIEVEAAKIDSRYVHLRFTHTNRYWSQNNATDRFIVAVTKAPEEDRTKPSCTLFEPITTALGDGSFYLNHVQSGGRVILGLSTNFAVANVGAPPSSMKTDLLSFVDWESVVQLPMYVAFKGPNGKYLKPFDRDGKPFLQFSSDDPNEQGSGYQVAQLFGSRSVTIKSNGTGKYWRPSPENWILADSDYNEEEDAIEFQAVRGDGNTIALTSAASHHFFCQIFSDGRVTDCLNAMSPTLVKGALLEVHELVAQRNIYNVQHQLEDARIYDETPFVAGRSTVINYADHAVGQKVSVKFEDEKSYTFSRGFSTTAAVTTTIHASVPFITETGISISFQISGNFQWDTTTTTKLEVSDSSTVEIPPRSTAVINYVGTKGYCSIPYSYIQEDRSSATGEIVNTQRKDGIFVSDSSYNFKFVVEKIIPL